MMWRARELRLIPIVLFATICLFGLKMSGLVFEGGYTLAERMQGLHKTDMTVTPAATVPAYPNIIVADQQVPTLDAGPKQSWAQEMFNYADKGKGDVTGSVGGGGGGGDKPAAPPLKTSDKPPEAPKLQVAGSAYPLEVGKITPPGERAVLERLQERRIELDTRNRDIDMRESLLKAAEQRVEAKVAELKAVEARVNAAMGARETQDLQRFKSIVSMYENMKAKEAARIFDRLDMTILVDVATAMNTRRMSEILAQMTPESAEKLTVALANRANATVLPQGQDQLPKIEGRPGN
ncbi:MAG: flagellar protein FlbB [Bradyrhizobium sp.]|nr:flagellar protein FlbB [Bradyrhizobium sp.]